MPKDTPTGRGWYRCGMRHRPAALIIALLLTALTQMLGLTGCVGTGPRGTSTPATTPPTATPPTWRVVSYNIRHGRGTDERVDLDRTAAVLRALAPDVVGLQEVDRIVRRSGGVDEAAQLGAALGMSHAFGAFMPYQGGEYGLAILSRVPIVRAVPIRLPDGNEPRVALAATLVPSPGDTIVVVNVHFDWVDDDGFRFAQATALTQVLDTLSHPYLLLGDFNDEPGSRTLALFHARATEVAKPAADRFTFSSTAPEKEIDFVFAAPRARWRVRGARSITEPLASDHRPVLAEVQAIP